MTAPTDLDALEAVIAKATPGTWTANNGGYETDHPGGFIEQAGSGEIEPDDAALCALHNAAPTLIAELRTLRAKLAILDAPETVGAVARAMCVQGGYDPDERMANDGPRWKYYVPQTTAALAAVRAMMEKSS